MNKVQQLSIRRAHRLFQSGSLSSQDLCRYCYNMAIAGEEVWKLGAFAEFSADVQEQAAASNQRWRDGKPLSPLDGIPITIKSNLAVAQLSLTAGSRILGSASHDPPQAGYTADAVQALLDGGAVILGTTTMDEFGMGSLGANMEKPSRNPLPLLAGRVSSEVASDEDWLSRIQSSKEAIFEEHTDLLTKNKDSIHYAAGGSSAGSAISISHGSSLLSLGSDTGGSVRLPAAWCNVVGLKPSYGRISRRGLVAYASSLDCVGVLGGSVECVQAGLKQIVEKQSQDNDATLVDMAYRCVPFTSGEKPLDGISVGLPAALSISEFPESVKTSWLRAAEQLQDLGATISTVSVDKLSPDLVQKSLAAYYVIASAEASSNLARYDGFRYGVAADQPVFRGSSEWSVLEQQFAASRTEGLGEEVIRRILCGTSVLSSDRFHTYYEAAFRVRADLTVQLDGVTSEHDALLLPTVAYDPIDLTSNVDMTQALVNDILTVPASLAGLPAISLPSGAQLDPSSSPFTHSVQLIGQRYQEEKLLAIAQLFEE